VSYSEDEKLLKQVLNTIINSTAGLKHVLVIDNTGITIMSESKFNVAKDDVTVEKIGAIGGAVFIAGEEQGQILGYGDIRIQITEYFEGFIFSAKVGNGVLCIATDTKVQVGFIRALLNRYAIKIGQILSNYLKQDQEGINNELKALFGTDMPL